jgi:hypothetical protein
MVEGISLAEAQRRRGKWVSRKEREVRFAAKPLSLSDSLFGTVEMACGAG